MDSCGGEFVPIPNTGRGHCILLSCVDHGLILSVQAGSDMAARSLSKVTVNDEKQNVQYLSKTGEVEPADWPTTDLLLLIA